MEMINDNIASTNDYLERRKRFIKQSNKFFRKRKEKKELRKEIISSSENYKLIKTVYKTKKGCWSYTKGEIIDLKMNEEIFTIYRNYGSFLYKWIEHQNDNEYLICGEDYQGYVILNLTKKKKHIYFPENGLKGCGFCWVDIEDYDKEFDNTIRIEGCYWGAPFEIVEFDFSNPDEIPYREISRKDVVYEDEGE